MTTLNADQTVASDLLLRKLELIDQKMNLFSRMQGKTLTRKEMLARYDIGYATLNKRIAAGQLPAPGTDGRWLVDEVFEYKARR